ncbi:MAG TPA: substrate-binding domain-containing protein, partial [Ktedonosporobacter sp.]|nr:substrate-binding domain-containing protein [Ktedonosporobacter sp.]
ADNLLIDRFLATPLSAGLVAVFPGRLSSQLTQLARRGFPVVVIDDQEVQVVPSIGVDNITGSYLAVRHLLQLGHRRIAHIKGPAEYLVSYARYQGYCRALFEADILPDPELVLEGDFLPPGGKACASQLFALPPEKRPTAIFAASDQMAYGVLAAAEDFGLAIPHDVALVGFDDDHPSAHTHPPLTTVRQPYFEMGQQAVALLVSLLNNPASHSDTLPSGQWETLPGTENPSSFSHRPAIQVQLQASLVVRESCGANYHSPAVQSSHLTLP